MEKLCYVIMPYGGAEQKVHFNMVYQLYMFVPALEKGYKVIREDTDPQPGSITGNIIRHLAEADLVIADLSNNNWNVAYELGIRHCFSKGKTILLCDDKTDLKFDIRGFHVIPYNGDNPAENVFSIQEKIKKAIDTRCKTPIAADNLVHEAFSFAHDNLIEYLNNEDVELVSQFSQLKTDYESMREENEQLREELKKAGQSPERITETQDDIIIKIEDAMNSMKYSGDTAVLRLRQEFARSDPDYNEIQNILQQTLTLGYLTEANFRSMYHLLASQAKPQLANLVLEVGEQRYPESLDIKSYLADAYSNNYKTRDKAIEYADEVLEITIVDGKRRSECKKIDDDQLGACLNAYIRVRRFDIMIEIIPQLLEKLSGQRELLLRNLATAYRENGNKNAERKTLETLLEEYPMSDVNHYKVFAFLRRMNKDLEALYHLEIAAALDLTDEDYPLALAGYIFDEHYYRAGDGKIKRIFSREECAKTALPFLMQAMKVSSSNQCLQKCKDFILRNGIGQYIAIFDEWIKDGMAEFGILDLDYSGVKYIMELGKSLNEDMCNRIYNLEDSADSCEEK